MAGRRYGTASQRSLVLRVIYASCLAGATYNHWATIHQHGLFWDYGGVPRASAAFWTLLAILDPAAVILLFARPNAGVAATAAIIVTDVVHNVWIEARGSTPLLQAVAASPRMIEQIAFMVFVAATARFAWVTKRAPPA